MLKAVVAHTARQFGRAIVMPNLTPPVTTTAEAAAYRRRMAVKSVLVAAGIIIGFALSGAGFLSAMGISIDSFRIFGGLLLFLVALEMVFARESGTRTSTDEHMAFLKAEVERVRARTGAVKVVLVGNGAY